MDNDNKTMAHSNMQNAIVSIASEVFAKFGFKKTTVDDIAQALRKGKSSIYYYFKSKEDIFKAVVEKEADALREKINVILNSDLTTIDKVRAYVNTRMQAIQVMANYYTLVSERDVNNLDLIEKLRSKYDTEEVSIIKALLTEGVEQKVFQVKDIELSSVVLLTAMKGLEVPLFLEHWRTESLDTILNDMLNMLFYGIVIRNS
ncbi:TetR/AcrR family transcriptional regulator [Perlabentimonas gracilis]|uniref:TetR/AcrR family transcriptional regulator n=1 Tax=Perlabentimonas gracilis TaxID=2715279 RepID=UPI00140AB0E7|nr:TetR/AcrR family transcriptional regulator [Perlabentimonas gracilis]NHB68907.1 TetR/AcrR family transcriptional regulator [Perlabentimonas gracilis]